MPSTDRRAGPTIEPESCAATLASKPSCRVYENFSWRYDDALAWMEQNRQDAQGAGPMWLGVGSHEESVLTLGRHAPSEQILSAERWRSMGGLVRRVERGGGATAHNPGQVVLYPIFSLHKVHMDIPGFTFALEEAAIRLLADLALSGERKPESPGVFVGDAKIASLGFRVQHGIVTHGMALNCYNDLSIFGEITACGVVNARVTSVGELRPNLGVGLDRIARRLCAHLAEICVLDSEAVGWGAVSLD